MRGLAVGIGVLVSMWLAGLVTSLVLGASRMSDAAILVLLLIATTGSVWLRTTWAAYLLGGTFSFRLAEFGAHMAWGQMSVQGRAEHLAVLGAALCGVAVGAAIAFGSARGIWRKPGVMNRT